MLITPNVAVETDRGTFTTHAATKKGNRDAEHLLHRLELVSVLALLLTAHSEHR